MIAFLNKVKKNMALICIMFGLFAAMFVFFSWSFGYWMNGLYGTHFQIDSCWQGYTAMAVGLLGIMKWLIDSALNSPKNSFPNATENKTPTADIKGGSK